LAWYDEGLNFRNEKRRGRFKRIELDRERLKQAYLSGRKVRDIAEEFGVSTATIKRHIKFLIPDSVKRNKGWTANTQNPRNQRIRELYEAGKSTLVIARLLGCGDEFVRQRLIKMGVERRDRATKSLLDYHPSRFGNRGRTYPIGDLPAFNEKLLYFYCLGYGQGRIASFLKVDKGTVRRRIRASRKAYVFKIRQCRRCQAIYRTTKHNSRICPRCVKPTTPKRAWDGWASWRADILGVMKNRQMMKVVA